MSIEECKKAAVLSCPSHCWCMTFSSKDRDLGCPWMSSFLSSHPGKCSVKKKTNGWQLWNHLLNGRLRPPNRMVCSYSRVGLRENPRCRIYIPTLYKLSIWKTVFFFIFDYFLLRLSSFRFVYILSNIITKITKLFIEVISFPPWAVLLHSYL